MIPPADEWPVHFNLRYANTISPWFNADGEELFNINCSNSEKRERLESLGWLDSTITYRFNQQGFRSIEFNPDLKAGLALGCSFTQGVGVPDEFAWPSIVGKELACPIYNLGIGGASMDTVFRFAQYWIPVLRPKFVVLACPSSDRVELVEPNGNIISLTPSMKTDYSDFYKHWILHPMNAKINYEKNILAITTICNQLNIPLAMLSVDKDFKHDACGRDLLHPGVESHGIFANKMIEELWPYRVEGLI